uniref:Uncharacterized protein n=1 Tax=Arundo donax TaxID=35708 RepID=A0A0A9EI96_ARUDO
MSSPSAISYRIVRSASAATAAARRDRM